MEMRFELPVKFVWSVEIKVDCTVFALSRFVTRDELSPTSMISVSIRPVLDATSPITVFNLAVSSTTVRFNVEIRLELSFTSVLKLLIKFR